LDRVNRQREEPDNQWRRQPSCDDTSRMNREVHVRICERLGVGFPGPTRQWGQPPEKKATLCVFKLSMVFWVLQTPQPFELRRRVFGGNGAEFVGVIPILEAIKSYTRKIRIFANVSYSVDNTENRLDAIYCPWR
jgi:hypothetical protein